MCKITEAVTTNRRENDHHHNLVMELLKKNKLRLTELETRISKGFNINKWATANWKTLGIIVSFTLSTSYYYIHNFDNMQVAQAKEFVVIQKMAKTIDELDDELSSNGMETALLKNSFDAEKEANRELHSLLKSAFARIEKQLDRVVEKGN